MSESSVQSRIEKLDQVMEAQKRFRPDPDTRERAEGNLLQLVEMRAKIARNVA